MSGEEACNIDRYHGVKCLAGVGGELVWAGDTKASLISSPDEQWDQVLLIRYHSIEAFLR